MTAVLFSMVALR